jgi:ParB/RepB/Spo0J family partition protein
MSELIFLHHTQLKLHPNNIRRYYHPNDVTKMSASIKAANGVLQSLLVYPDGGGTYFVVDGNMRLAGARELGDKCPLLKCEVIEANRFEQLLMMTITSEFHFPKDPISLGLHYQRLIDQEGLSIIDIAKMSGVSRGTIDKTLKILELDPEIQDLIANGKLSPDLHVSRALLSIPDVGVRIRMAQRFAERQTSIPRIVSQCTYILRQLVRLPATNGIQDQAQKILDSKEAKITVTARALQTKAAKKEQPGLCPEAVEMIYGVATKTLCEGCRLDGLSEECYLCPGPKEFIDHLVEMCEARAQ